MTQKISTHFLRLSEVVHTVGASKTTIYVWIGQGRFPKPYKLGTRRVGWLASEVEAWARDLQKAA